MLCPQSSRRGRDGTAIAVTRFTAAPLAKLVPVASSPLACGSSQEVTRIDRDYEGSPLSSPAAIIKSPLIIAARKTAQNQQPLEREQTSSELEKQDSAWQCTNISWPQGSSLQKSRRRTEGERLHNAR